MKKNIFKIIIPTFIYLFILNGCSFYYPSLRQNTFLCMGTQIEVIFVVPKDVSIDSKELMESIEKKCKQYEDKFSFFESNSVVSKINSSKQCYIDSETKELLSKSIYLSDLTDGAFDFTVVPLLKIWGFYNDDENKIVIPSEEKIQLTVKYVGYKKINLKDNFLRKDDKEIKIDLSAIAKGFVVDKIIQMIKAEGIEQALVNAGGDMYCMGKAPDNESWRIGIRHPHQKNSIIGRLNIKDKAIVTSGDYEKFFRVGEKRYSHIFNPFTGYPVSNNILSVTVIALDTVTADALATAVMVLGSEEGLKLINKLDNVDVIIAKQIEDEIEFFISQGLEKEEFNLKIEK